MSRPPINVRTAEEVKFLRERYGLSLVEADILSRNIALLQESHQIRRDLEKEVKRGIAKRS
jgi:TPP-dependent pyruvate/acetoin dehydrogenase alpha subunit